MAERLHAALEAQVGFPVPLAKAEGDSAPEDAQLFLARFERDVCTVSADTSGVLLHQRGWRGPQAKAPLRETLAAALLLAAGFRGDGALSVSLTAAGLVPLRPVQPGLAEEMVDLRAVAASELGQPGAKGQVCLALAVVGRPVTVEEPADLAAVGFGSEGKLFDALMPQPER